MTLALGICAVALPAPRLGNGGPRAAPLLSPCVAVRLFALVREIKTSRLWLDSDYTNIPEKRDSCSRHLCNLSVGCLLVWSCLRKCGCDAPLCRSKYLLSQERLRRDRNVPDFDEFVP